jgi:glycosyltransferase involved in cell wall biosynthesis
LTNQNLLAIRVWRERPTFVLCESFSEYLAPLWFVLPWLAFRFMGIPFVTNLHDPVRDFRIGPVWWHRLSIACAYSHLRLALAHQSVPPEALVPPHVRVVEVPVGVYSIAPFQVDPAGLRAGWKFPPGAQVFLAFGYLRNNKNLDLVLKAMADVPGAYLVVVGQASASHCRPFDFYRKLASELGLLERVRFYDQFVSDSDLGAWFAAADFIVLTYAASFVSQSGVLNVAAGVRKPVLASSGPGPLRKAVEDFWLGVFVEPDSVSAIADGMRQLLSGKTPAPDWNGYTEYASWKTNVAKMLAALPNRL